MIIIEDLQLLSNFKCNKALNEYLKKLHLKNFNSDIQLFNFKLKNYKCITTSLV